jgi:SlyX protein
LQKEGVMSQEIEEQIAHLTRTVDELSDVIARQERDMERLARRVGLLLEREAEREAEGAGTIPLADQRPPHW